MQDLPNITPQIRKLNKEDYIAERDKLIAHEGLLRPTAEFLQEFNRRLGELPDPGGDSEEYLMWGIALCLGEDGEEAVSQMKLWTWYFIWESTKTPGSPLDELMEYISELWE